jgi:hypothetical protein
MTSTFNSSHGGTNNTRKWPWGVDVTSSGNPDDRSVERRVRVNEMTETEYQWSDVWLLQSIMLSGKGGASLLSIIGIGDGINHAIFTDDELESGFARLTAGGLITERDHKFFTTAKADELYEKASKKGGSIFAIRGRLEKLLEASPWEPRQKGPNPPKKLSYPGFSPGAVQEACRRYKRQAKRTKKLDR